MNDCAPFDCGCNDGASYQNVAVCDHDVCLDEKGVCEGACTSNGGWSGPSAGDYGTDAGTGSLLQVLAGPIRWVRKFGASVAPGHVTPDAAGDLRATVKWFYDETDLGDGIARDLSSGGKAFVHLGVDGALKAVHDATSLGTSAGAFDEQHGLRLVGNDVILWEESSGIQRLNAVDAPTALSPAYGGFSIIGAFTTPNASIALIDPYSSGPLAWGAVALPDMYAWVRLDGAGTPVAARPISAGMTIGTWPKPLVDATGNSYFADWVWGTSNEWTYDGAVQGSAPQGVKAAYLLALAPDGAKRWSKTLWSSHVPRDRPFGMALNPSGRLVIVTWADQDFGAGPYGSADELAIVRFDAAGAPSLVTKVASTPQAGWRPALGFRPDGSFLVTGGYRGTWTDGAATHVCNAPGATCAFLMSFDASGVRGSSAFMEGCAGNVDTFDAPVAFADGYALIGRNADCKLGGQLLDSALDTYDTIVAYVVP